MSRMKTAEFISKVDGLTSISETAREAQASAREALMCREYITVTYADASDGNHWEYRKSENGKITRTKRPGNLR